MSARDILVSVIIPTYNYGHYIVDCVNSVLAQRVNTEIIIVDDGSTDRTADVIETFKNRVTYLVQANKGPSAARNTGIKHASGDFVQFLDADDLLGPDAISAKVSFLNENPGASVAVSPSLYFTSLAADGRPETNGRWPLRRQNFDVHLAHFNIAPPNAFFLRRTVVEDVGYFDESLRGTEDYDYWLRAGALGYVPHYCGTLTDVFYRRHPTSLSMNHRNQYYHDAKMHRTVLELFLCNSKITVSQNHWLAFLAGVLTTLSRSELQDDPILEELHLVLSRALNESGSYLPPVLENLDACGLLYWRVARQRLRQLGKLNNQKLHSISDAAEMIKLSWSVKSARKDLARIIQGWRDDPLDAPKLARRSLDAFLWARSRYV